MDSYDIFETVLLRLVGDPTSLFRFVGQKAVQEGVLNCSAENFWNMRIEAEKESYKRMGHPDLNGIYRTLGDIYSLEARVLAYLLAEELRLEKEWSRPNPAMAALVATSRKANGHVLYLSDMYLPKNFLEENLRHKGLIQDDDRLYLSNHEKAGKGDGQLFITMLEHEGLTPESCLHNGNCRHVDVDAPRKLNIQTSHYAEGNLTPQELFLESHSGQTEGLSSLWAGASRRGRCAIKATHPDGGIATTLLNTAVSVAGPLLTNYVHWCLAKAIKDDVRNLVFIARDGQILYKIASLLHEAEPAYATLNIHYIHGSRQAWRPASITTLGDFEKEWVLEGREITPQKVAARLGLDDDAAKSLPNSNCPDLLWKAVLTRLAKTTKEEAARKRNLVTTYLDQVDLLGKETTAFAEIGCTGTTMAALDRILNLAGAPLPCNYFFGLSSKLGATAPSKAATYFYDGRSDQGLIPSTDFNYYVMLEMFCAATDGRTMGYKHECEKVVPILDRPQQYWDKTDEQVRILQAGILSFAEAYADSPLLQPTPPPTTALSLSVKVIRKFWQEPTADEAEVWGSYRKEHDQCGFGAPEMGRAYTVRDLAHCVRTQGLPETWWPAATRMRTAPSTMKLLKAGTQAGKGLAKARIQLGGLKKRLLGKS